MIGALSSEKRCSLNPRLSDTRLSVTRLSHQITPQDIRTFRTPKSSIVGHIFLCMLGTILSISVCIWLTFFSAEIKERRLIFSGAAAICAITFTLLAIVTIKNNRKKEEPEIDISRSSFIIQRRSLTSNSLCRNTKTGEDLITRPASSMTGESDQRYMSNVLSIDDHFKRGTSA